MTISKNSLSLRGSTSKQVVSLYCNGFKAFEMVVYVMQTPSVLYLGCLDNVLFGSEGKTVLSLLLFMLLLSWKLSLSLLSCKGGAIVGLDL